MTITPICQRFSESNEEYSATVVKQLAQASKKINADCDLCQLGALCSNTPGLQPDIQQVRKKEIIYRPGDRSNYLYSLRRGSIKTSRFIEPDNEQILGFGFAGELFGFDGLAHPTQQQQTTALEDSVLCRYPLRRLVDGNPNPGFPHLLRLMSQQVLQLQQHASLINRSQANTRVAAFLLDVASRSRCLPTRIAPQHTATPAPVTPSASRSSRTFKLPINRNDIASYLGLTVETISRRLSQLERDHIIYIQRPQRHVELLDIERLQHIAFA